MDIENLRCFLAVVEHGHFGTAATRLDVPQSTLTRRIQRLESELGCPLLVRSARPVAPSVAGRAFAEHARTMVRAADRAAEQLRSLADGRGGLLRIGYVQSATFGWVTRLLATARRRRIDVELVAAPTVRQLSALHDHRLDAGVVRPSSAGPSSAASAPRGLRTATLSRDALFAVLPKGHPTASARVLGPADLAGESLVLYPETEGPGLRNLVNSWLAGGPTEGGTAPPRVHDAWDAPSAVALAAAGTGIAILPGPLPPLPPTTTARPLTRAPRLELALTWHPVDEPVIQPFARSLQEPVRR